MNATTPHPAIFVVNYFENNSPHLNQMNETGNGKQKSACRIIYLMFHFVVFLLEFIAKSCFGEKWRPNSNIVSKSVFAQVATYFQNNGFNENNLILNHESKSTTFTSQCFYSL